MNHLGRRPRLLYGRPFVSGLRRRQGAAGTPDRAGVWWVIASATSYSLFTVFSKGVLDDLRPTDVLFWRFAIAAPVAWCATAVRAARLGPTRVGAPAGPFLGAGGVFGVVALLAFGALDHLSAALYVVIIYTYPAMVAVGAAALGRRPPRRVWVSIGITVIGIACTVPEVFDSPDADALGLVLTLGNALVYAIYVLGTGHLLGGDRAHRTDGLVASSYSFTGSLVFAAALLPFVGLRLPQDAATWFGLAGLGVVSTVIGGATLLVGMRRLPPATAALVATLEPVLTLIWAMSLLGESLVALQFVGAALVIGGVVWSQRVSPVPPGEPG